MSTHLALDHVNLRTGRLAEMVAWYRDTLGLAEGWRPPFDFPGAWLYAGDAAVVHLVGVEKTPGAPADAVRIEHFAPRGQGMSAFLELLRRLDVPARIFPVPGATLTQVNIHDPDGNHIHVDFAEQP